jgi:protein O-mannosyl-transferase
LTVSPISENKTDLKSAQPIGKEEKRSLSTLSMLGLVVICAITAVAYRAVIQNIFHSDDYAHVRWASHAIEHPELVLQAFSSSWVGCQTVPFYRPLSSLLIFIDYCIWGNNGFGFHLTNFVLHIATSLAVWALTREFGKRIAQLETTEKTDGPDRRTRLWALAAAGLFAVYPLHPEAVSWMIGRVDLLATFFSVSAFWLYIRWRNHDNKRALALSLGCFAGSLCSKETGVVLPAVLLAYSVLIENCFGVKNSSSVIKAMTDGLFRAIKATVPFWLVLGAYLLVRVVVLKSIVGGYGNALPGPKELHVLLGVWIPSVSVLFCPFNAQLISASDFVVGLWQAITVVCGLIALNRFICNRVSTRFGAFLIAWMTIALLPVLKYFVLTPDLQGGRMAYMCCIPLCMILTHGIAYSLDRYRLRLVAYAISTIYICAGAILTMRNNESWKQAGEEMRAVHQALNSQYQSFPSDKILYFAGVPDQIHGAYAAANAMEALFQRPQMPEDLHMCNNLSPADLFQPYGYVRNTLFTTEACKLYTWDSALQKFQAFHLANLKGLSRSWKHEQLKTMLMSKPALELPSNRKALEFDFSGQGLNGWDAEFLELKLQVVRPVNGHDDSRIKMRFKNHLKLDYDDHSVVASIVQPGEAYQTLAVPMHSNVLWSLGGECKTLCFDFPADWKVDVLEISTMNGKRFLPSIEIQPKTPATSLGVVWSNRVGSRFNISYDVSGIQNAVRAELEITKPNVFFLRQNADGPVVETDNVVVSEGTTGRIAVDTKNYSNGQLYEMRVRALDSEGQPVGFASDHIVFVNSSAAN